jgi:hypothetical protein
MPGFVYVPVMMGGSRSVQLNQLYVHGNAIRILSFKLAEFYKRVDWKMGELRFKKRSAAQGMP